MAEPDRTSTGRKLIWGVTLIAILAVAAVFFIRKVREDREAPTPPAAAVAPSAPAPPKAPAPVPLPAAPLSRSDLLAAAASATRDYALGEAAEEPDPLLGRRFRISLPFGCDGAQTAGGDRWASWDYGPDRTTFKVTVRPQDWTQSGFARELGPEFEAMKGFWIPRPWSASEDCPVRSSDPLQAAPPQPSPQTLGLAMLLEKGGSRLGLRGDRAFELTAKVPADAAGPAPKGLRLVLEGRVTGFEDGRAVRCRAASADQRPVCLVGVNIEQVRVVEPASGGVLGEWRN